MLCTLNSTDAIPVVAQETIEFLDGGKNAQKLQLWQGRSTPSSLMFCRQRLSDIVRAHQVQPRQLPLSIRGSLGIVYRASGHLLVKPTALTMR